MRKEIWLPLLPPLPFALIFYFRTFNALESSMYYLIFVVVLWVSVFFYKRKPKRDSHKNYSDPSYDDYMI